MKKGWEYKALGEIAKICGGKRIPKGYKLQSEPTNHKYIRVADFLDNGTVHEDDIQYISDEIYNQIKRYTITSDDVYISIAGTIGKSGIVSNRLNGANLTENACKLVLCKELNTRFVYHVTTSPFFQEQISALTKKSAQPKLALTRLATVEFPLPPLSEQQEIVEYLDSAFAKIDAIKANAEKALTEAKALFQASLKSLLEPKDGWTEKTLREVCSIKSGNSTSNYSPPGDLPYIKVADLSLQNNELYINVANSYVDRDLNKKYVIPNGTVIFPKRGGAIYTNKKRIAGRDICCDLNIMGVIPSCKIKSIFLYYYFVNIDFKDLCNGAAIPQINNCDINPLIIHLPSLDEQDVICDELLQIQSKVDQLQANYDQIAKECDALKQAILRQVFE